MCLNILHKNTSWLVLWTSYYIILRGHIDLVFHLVIWRMICKSEWWQQAPMSTFFLNVSSFLNISFKIFYQLAIFIWSNYFISHWKTDFMALLFIPHLFVWIIVWNMFFFYIDNKGLFWSQRTTSAYFVSDSYQLMSWLLLNMSWNILGIPITKFC